ncbi:hypothetical protein F5877DRAFT_73238, partial [Lentinula edodes]
SYLYGHLYALQILSQNLQASNHYPLLPCPYDGPPKEPSTSTRNVLREVCGPEFSSGPLTTLEDNFRIVDKIVSACPACKNNFHDFFCKFTCSPNQGSFLNVTSTQTTNNDQIAVKSVDFYFGPQFVQGFFESCKDVKFDASSGYAMDFIGGGAKNYHDFFKFLEEEKDMGSPFQINFPSTSTPGFILGFVIQRTIRKRRERRYGRLALSGETPTSPRALVGAASLDNHNADLARDPIDPVETVQPKQYKLNTLLRKIFYKLGFNTATYPMLTCAVVFTFIGLINISWTKFDIETDPVPLWVAPNSETRQIFIISTDQENQPVLSFEHLQYVFALEKHTRHKLVSLPNNLTLDDMCFSPAGPGSPCVVQSVLGWFGDSLDGYDENTYKDRIERCTRSPVECLPDFGQPLVPYYVPGGTRDGNLNTYLNAPALVMTAVLPSSLSPPDPEQQQTFERAAEEWERTLRIRAPIEAGLNVDFSTGVSWEEEIRKEGNTDVRIVVGSYIAMFLYVGLTLRGGGSGPSSTRRASPDNANRWRRHWRAAILGLQSYTLTSHTLLALFSLVLVVLSISRSVALFSLVGVRVTLVVAEVIPFLVLAVGVDNVFLLMGELERVDAVHGLYAGNSNVLNEPGNWGHRGRGNERNAAADEDDGIAENGDAEARMMLPTRTTHSSRYFRNSSRHNHHTSSLSFYSSAPSSVYPKPSYLPPPARIALTPSLIGPSILLSTLAESVAFLLGALVPVPGILHYDRDTLSEQQTSPKYTGTSKDGLQCSKTEVIILR